MSSGPRALLEGFGHLEALEGLPLPGGPRWQLLGRRSRRVLGALHAPALREALEAPGAGRAAGGAAWRGRALWLLGREGEARGELEAAASAGDEEGAAFLGALETASRPARAAALLEEACARAPKDPWPRLWLGACLAGGEGLEKRRALPALEDFEARLGRPHPLSRLLAGVVRLGLEDPAGAAAEGDAALALEPGCAVAYGLRSAARLGLGDLEGSLADFHEAKDRDPDCGFDSADRLLGGPVPEEPAEAVAAWDRAIARHPRAAAFYAARAELKRHPRLALLDEALEDYRRAAALEPRRAWLQAHLARAEAHRAGLGSVLERLDGALSLAPEAGWIRAWRGEARRLLGRGAEALSDLDEAVGRMPWLAYAHAWRGAVLAGASRWEEALLCLDGALVLEPAYPTDAFAHFWRGRARLGLGRAEEAAEDFRTAMRLDGPHPRGRERVLGALREALAR